MKKNNLLFVGVTLSLCLIFAGCTSADANDAADKSISSDAESADISVDENAADEYCREHHISLEGNSYTYAYGSTSDSASESGEESGDLVMESSGGEIVYEDIAVEEIKKSSGSSGVMVGKKCHQPQCLC